MFRLPRWKGVFGTKNEAENILPTKVRQDDEADTEVIFSDFFAEELLQCEVGSRITLWTKEHFSNINGYREGTYRGQGKSVELMKDDNPGIARYLELGHPVWLTVTERTSSKFEFKVHVDPMQRQAPEEVGGPDDAEELVEFDDLEVTVDPKVALERVRKIMSKM